MKVPNPKHFKADLAGLEVFSRTGRKLQLVVTGHSEHGKDTVCDLLAPFISFKGSSEVACALAVYPKLKDIYGYSSPEECFEDRRNHKQEWFELIQEYNAPSYTKLGEAIFKDSNVYCGLRSLREYRALKAAGLVDYMIWVDASKRKPAQNSESMTITREHCTVTIDNNGTEAELFGQIHIAFNKLLAIAAIA